MQGDPKQFQNYLNSCAWAENAAIWHRNYLDMIARVRDGRKPRNQKTFNEIVRIHRRWRAALANAIAFASA